MAWAAVGVQFVLWCVSAWAIVRAARVLAKADREDAAVLIDVWLQLAIAVPLLGFLWRVDPARPVVSDAWPAFGGAAVVGLFAVGGVLLRSTTREPGDGMQVLRRAAACWLVVGVIGLLIAAYNELSVWTGQSAFALAAVMMWLNTPGSSGSAHSEEDDDGLGRASGLVFLALLAGVGQAVCIAIVSGHESNEWPVLASAVVAIAGGLFIAGRLAGLGAVGLRIGGWVAAFGVLLGFGICSLRHMLPQFLTLFDPYREAPAPDVAFGFARFAPEMMAVVVIGVLGFAGSLMERRIARLTGVALICVVGGLAAWRLAGLIPAAGL